MIGLQAKELDDIATAVSGISSSYILAHRALPFEIGRVLRDSVVSVV